MAGKADAAGLPVFRVMKIVGLLRMLRGGPRGQSSKVENSRRISEASTVSLNRS